MPPLRLPHLSDPDEPFPDPRTALREPDGLLATGGDLSPGRLLSAYRLGIFPWFGPGQPILWWSPDPRTVFPTGGFRLSPRFRRSLRRSPWVLRADTAFGDVIHACASAPRAGQHGTWITDSMLAAYIELHRLGHAHSVEVFDGNTLVGGIYGVSVGRMFFGESMFSAVSGGSKAALAGLVRHMHRQGWPLLDAQVGNDHLALLGAEAWPRERFLEAVDTLVTQDPGTPDRWTDAFGCLAAAALATPVT